jgi:hypothetical protein
MLRALTACLALAAAASAQPALTTISDILFRADGKRFNGLAQITWMTFEASNGAYIAQQSKTVRIIDGRLFVQLTPTTSAVPPSLYSVKYSADGRIQFQEAWAVPPSTVALKVRDVRTTDPLFPGGGAGGAGENTQVQIGDVIGLVAELAVRVVKGPGFAHSRAAVINDTGQIEAALGAPGDCVRVDGSSGPCGGGATFVDQEVPSGAVDGANAVFAIANAPAPASSLHLYRNGLLQKAGFDFSLSGSTITFVTAAIPQPGDTLLASYRR